MRGNLTREEQEASIQAFLANGGEVIRLREATKKDQMKASRRAYHEEKALCGSERSKKILEQEKNKEASFIFSRTERNKAR
tara:strand:+ start:14164 stop:14406 length:243 start_codon:yes stop_codon:yes gene_type:complete